MKYSEYGHLNFFDVVKSCTNSVLKGKDDGKQLIIQNWQQLVLQQNLDYVNFEAVYLEQHFPSLNEDVLLGTFGSLV